MGQKARRRLVSRKEHIQMGQAARRRLVSRKAQKGACYTRPPSGIRGPRESNPCRVGAENIQTGNGGSLCTPILRQHPRRILQVCTRHPVIILRAISLPPHQIGETPPHFGVIQNGLNFKLLVTVHIHCWRRIRRPGRPLLRRLPVRFQLRHMEHIMDFSSPPKLQPIKLLMS